MPAFFFFNDYVETKEEIAKPPGSAGVLAGV